MTLLLGAFAQVTLLGVMVFIAEPPEHVGQPVRAFHAWEFAYLALPLALVAACAVVPARAFLRRRRLHDLDRAA